jgi:hypothetical protein
MTDFSRVIDNLTSFHKEHVLLHHDGKRHIILIKKGVRHYDENGSEIFWSSMKITTEPYHPNHFIIKKGKFEYLFYFSHHNGTPFWSVFQNMPSYFSPHYYQDNPRQVLTHSKWFVPDEVEKILLFVTTFFLCS